MAVTTVKAGERKPLNVLGMPLTMLCEAHETGGAWSLFEEKVPLGMGPPPHRHDWDESYYILEGEVEFTIDGRSVRSSRADFNTCLVAQFTASKAHQNALRASSYLPRRRTGRSSFMS